MDDADQWQCRLLWYTFPLDFVVRILILIIIITIALLPDIPMNVNLVVCIIVGTRMMEVIKLMLHFVLLF